MNLQRAKLSAVNDEPLAVQSTPPLAERAASPHGQASSGSSGAMHFPLGPPTPDATLETVRALPEPVILCDRALRVLMANTGATSILGLPVAPLAGADLGEVLAASPHFTPGMTRLLLRAVTAVLEGGEGGEWRSTGPVLLTCDIALLPGGVLLIRPRAMPAQPGASAGFDPLTGLDDRQGFIAKVDAMLRDRRRRICAVAILDFRGFRFLNNELGHSVGDGVLREAARRLKEGLRAQDLVARIGADEFAVLHVGVESPEVAERVAGRLAARLSEPLQIEGHLVILPSRAGIALAPDDGKNAAALLRCAGLALAEVKVAGIGMVGRFDPGMEERARDRHEIATGLRDALDRREFVLFYQPLIDLMSERVIGFEALIRWQHPERGMIPPLAFIPIAEERGLIRAIGGWVLRTACAEAATWPEPLTVSVNVAVAQFSSGGLVDEVKAALKDSGLPGWRLELEVTESVALTQTDAVRSQVDAIRALGVRMAVDDFGTGYSSLAQLRSLPFDRLKIDRSFVGELPAGMASVAIIRAVTELGSALGLQITAEGVETATQRDGLRAMGCTAAQGFFYGRPGPATSVPEVLARLGVTARTAPQLS